MSVYMNDENVKLELEFRDYELVNGVMTDVGPLDISGATEITFKAHKPDGTPATEKTQGAAEVVLSTDGTDGKAYYLTDATFLDQAGYWKRQGKVELGGGVHHSKVVSFPVGEHL